MGTAVSSAIIDATLPPDWVGEPPLNRIQTTADLLKYARSGQGIVGARGAMIDPDDEKEERAKQAEQVIGNLYRSFRHVGFPDRPDESELPTQPERKLDALVQWLASRASPKVAVRDSERAAAQEEEVADDAGKRRAIDEETSTPQHVSLVRVLRLFTNGVVDRRVERAARVLDSDLTTGEKLAKFDALLPIPPTASGEQLGALLGVTKQAVYRTEWWLEHRKGERGNEIGRRLNIHRDRSAGSDPSPIEEGG